MTWHLFNRRPDAIIAPWLQPAGDVAFLMPCTPAFAAALLRLCAGPPAFDRVAFHRDFDARIVRFFRAQLAGDGEGR